MAFCKKCGARLPEGAAFCNKCGTAREKSGGSSLWRASGPKFPLAVTVVLAVLGGVAAAVYFLLSR